MFEEWFKTEYPYFWEIYISAITNPMKTIQEFEVLKLYADLKVLKNEQYMMRDSGREL